MLPFGDSVELDTRGTVIFAGNLLALREQESFAVARKDRARECSDIHVA